MLKRQKHAALRTLGMFFAEKGKILTVKEYTDCEDKPMPFYAIRRLFRSYPGMLNMLKRYETELWELAEGVKKEPEKVEPPKTEIQSKLKEAEAAVKKAAGPAPKPKTETKDGK